MPNVTAHHTGGNLKPIHAGKAGVLVTLDMPFVRSFVHENYAMVHSDYINDWNDDHNVTFDDCPVNAEDGPVCQYHRYAEFVEWINGSHELGSFQHSLYGDDYITDFERAGYIRELPPEGVKCLSNTSHWAIEGWTLFEVASVQNNSVLFNSKFAKYVRPSRVLIMDELSDLPDSVDETFPSLAQPRRQRFAPLFDEFMYRSPAVAAIIHNVDSWAKENGASNEQALRKALRHVVDLAERQREHIELLSKHNANPFIFRGDE